MTYRSPARIALLAALALTLSACGGAPAPAGAGAAPDDAAENTVQVSATYAEGGDGPAFTYDPALVPAGATVQVDSSATGAATTTTLRVSGLLPNRTYGGHVHTKPCAPTDGAAAGPHFQHSQDPVTPSVDPAYANPQNEVWLDVTTDANGAGESTSQVPWTFPDDRRPAAVVLHEKATATHAGHAGTAGARPACVTVDF